MLFIREYNAKSLDRSSVSMIDKYNVRLDIVGKLLDNLSSLIDNLMSLIRDIRTSLGQSKQRIYNNLDQVKEVIEGNGITGAESTIDAIESTLEAGDKAIDEAEATLEGIKAAIDCSEEYCDEAIINVDCGEACNETPPTDEGCDVCTYGYNSGGSDGSWTCEVCNQPDCNVDLSCKEDADYESSNGSCTYSVYCSHGEFECDETYEINSDCKEASCNYAGGFNVPDGCTFTCNHSTDCHESEMPDWCTYTCTDGEGCAYGDNDCSYSTTCGQSDSCNQYECDQYDCGEPCGETCHMDDGGSGSGGDSGGEGSCGEDDGSDDGPCNQYDCSEYDCGESCGESCGLDF